MTVVINVIIRVISITYLVHSSGYSQYFIIIDYNSFLQLSLIIILFYNYFTIISKNNI